MKKWIPAFFALPLSWLHAQSPVASFDDIRHWTGSGANRAALVLQWNDAYSPSALVWGYRWDGQATGLDMLRAIAGSTRIEDPGGDVVGSGSGSDNRLTLGLVQYSFGLSVLSLDYSPFQSAQRTQSDWNSGYWEYFISGGNFEYTNWGEESPSLYDVAGSPLYPADLWLSSPIGAGDRTLVDGAWDAYSFAPGFVSQSVQQPSAAPIPLPVLSCAIVAGQPHIGATSEAGYNYRLCFATYLGGPWQPMGSAVPGTGEQIVFVDETPAAVVGTGGRFYRIEVTR